MTRKNYTPAERALHLLGALAGKSRQEINDGTIRFKLWPKGMKIRDQTDASSIKDVRISKYGQVLPLRRSDA